MRSNLLVLFSVCPELWANGSQSVIMQPPFGNLGPHENPSWDGEAVARWFASRAQAMGLKPDGTARWRTSGKNMFGKYKVNDGAPEPAWAFPAGSTHINRYDDFETAYVFPDGRLMLTPIADSDRPIGVRYNLRGTALVRMAELLGNRAPLDMSSG